MICIFSSVKSAKHLIILLLSILSGVSFGIAVSTFFLTNGYLNSTYRAFVVQSGSMEPALKVGSFILTKTESDYSVGDIITFNVNNNIVTHRIQSIMYDDGKAFVTKGDANEEVDNWIVEPDSIVGTSVMTVPYLGYISNFVRTPKGFVALVVVPASIIVYEELKNIFREILSKFKKNTSSDDRSNTSFKIIIPVMGLFIALLGGTLSYFADSESSPSNILGAGSWQLEPTPPPATSSGTLVINEVYYNPDDDHILGNASENNFEWIELFNGSSSTVNLKDWQIVDNSTSRSISNSNRYIGPGEFIVLGKAENIRVVWGIDNNLFVAIGNLIGGGLANGGDELHLLDADDNEVDAVSYGSNLNALSPSVGLVAEGHSIERLSPGLDADTADDFFDNETPTPGS